jgi:tetratricopeptide (TPR) repeat protein
MYYRKYSKYELLWYRFGYTVIVDNLAKKLRWNLDAGQKPKLLWRYAYSQYGSGKFSQALITFERLDSLIAEKKEASKGLDLSFIYQFYARCHIYLFFSDQEKSHLETAYNLYMKAIQRIPTAVEPMFLLRMPVLLLETGRCLELYGSFEEAMETYAKILATFPNFRGYFVTMFRTAVVGRHLATLATSNDAKNDAVDKCIDILLFLLEAPPPEIPPVNLLLLYARTLELATDTQIKFRSLSVYHSFYILCKNMQIANAHSVEDEKAWNSSPDTWISIADYIEETNEFLIAKEAFLKYIEELSRSDPLYSSINFDNLALDIPTCMKLAKRFLKYENISQAIHYASMALKQEHYNKEIRGFLARYSTEYKEIFQREKNAVDFIRGFWKFRCWSWSFIWKLKEKTISDLKIQYEKTPYNMGLREKLCYYCKDEYRALFLYQEQCATRIKKWYFTKKWKYQQLMKVRKKFQLLASEYYHNYVNQTNNPNSHQSTNVNEVIRLKKNILKFLELKSNFIGKKHPLLTIGVLIQKQFHSIKVIQKLFKSFKLRRSIQQRIYTKKEEIYSKYIQNIVLIQSTIRKFLAYWRCKRLRFKMKHRNKLAKKIQHVCRQYLSSTKHTRTMKKKSSNRLWAKQLLKNKFTPYVLNYLKKRQEMKKRYEKKQKKYLKR